MHGEEYTSNIISLLNQRVNCVCRLRDRLQFVSEVSGWFFFFFGWVAGLKVLLVGIILLLVKYDPAGRISLPPPPRIHPLLFLSV